ncbi:MAG TPA: F0F1 ATP synthase subunit A, partial [Luteolibacter sp.]
MRLFLTTSVVSLFGLLSAFGAEGGEHHALPLYAPKLSDWLPVSNSMIMVWLAVGVITVFCRVATRKLTMVPAGLQNLAEWAVESLYDFLEGLLGAHLVKKTFWFFGAVFFFILVNNYMGLIPGVGTVGWHTVDSHGHHGFLPLLRGANADLNMTAAMAFSFATLWFYWAVTENGLKGFLSHIFAPKGAFRGVMMAIMVIVFFLVGILEVVSIGIRPVALSFRLFGNIYGGEQTMEALMALAPKSLAFLPALPFYFMELLVGFVQALVFTLLCAVFLKLICDHG